MAAFCYWVSYTSGPVLRYFKVTSDKTQQLAVTTVCSWYLTQSSTINFHTFIYSTNIGLLLCSKHYALSFSSGIGGYIHYKEPKYKLLTCPSFQWNTLIATKSMILWWAWIQTKLWFDWYCPPFWGTEPNVWGTDHSLEELERILDDVRLSKC